MYINSKVLFANRSGFESSFCALFPRHTTFFCMDSSDCKILKQKKDSKYNILNFPENFNWPNDNANEVLSYVVLECSYNDFLDRCDYSFPKGFFYANLVNYEKSNSNISTCELISRILNTSKVPTFITYPSNLDITEDLHKKITNWSEQNYIIIDPHNTEAVNVLTNYNLKKTGIGSAGGNASERQRVSRKSLRWEANFSDLPNFEQDFILMNLVTNYLNKR